MASTNLDSTVTRHMVAMPSQGRGHINPMMNLCKLLSARTDRLLITFVVTEEWLGFIGSDPKPDNIRFRTIPNVLPSELVRAANMPAFVEATMTKMEEPFEQLLDRLEPPPTIILSDTFLTWAVDVGNRRSIPVASFWPMPASVFSILYHFDLLVKNRQSPVNLSERGEERAEYIPGISSIRLADLPPISFKEQTEVLLTRLVKGIHNAQYLLFPSIFELESPSINTFKSILPFPVYSFGPLIPYFYLKENTGAIFENGAPDYLKWLDSQPPSSVLYISMGSFLSVSREQIDEIALGLRASGVRFLWVARGESTSRLIKEVCGDLGMVVTWCDQLKVLCHSSIGGFWTHCGWNSTMESVYAGVPLLTFPILMDQVPISKFIVEDWKIGWRVRKGVLGMENLVGREEIADLVKRFIMDPENNERKEMVRRAREIQEICRQAIDKGGSSDTNLLAFIRDISQH